MTKNLFNPALVLLVGALALGCNAKQGDDAKTGEKASAAKADDAPGKPGTPAAKGASEIIPVGDAYTKGGKDALVTIVEFSDFQCPFCNRVNPTLKSIQDKYGDKVRIAFKHNPLPFHKDAPLASQAAIAAGKQGKFWEMHDKLFANIKALKRENLDSYAKELGLDMAKFAKDIEDPATVAIVEADKKLAAKVGARGTPNFMINGRQLSGAQPLPKFVELIDEELKEAEALAKTGKSAAEVYAARVKANFKAPAKRPDARGQQDTSKTVYKIPAGTSPTKGGKEPLVKIIEFSEFQCPFCSRVLPTMDKILKEYGDDVQIVFKHNPLPFHKDAPGAAAAAIAAGNQGKFWEMHDKLFQSTKKLKPEDLETYATELGLDMAKFKADMESPATKKIIAADQALASQFGARGTPNFFVNGRQVTGARPFESFKTIIDEEIKKANDAIKAGTARSAVYQKLTEKGLTKAAAPPQRKPRAADNTVYKVPVTQGASTKGPADALVTIVEFSEFQCPFCKRVNPTIDQIAKKYGKDVRIVFKHNPLPFHKDAPGAAAAAIAAGNQGKFWEMHDKLFQDTKKLKPENIDSYAKELGLDMAKFKADLASEATKKQIAADQALARQFGASGTPNFFINGRKLVGAQPLANFTKIIDEEIKKANDAIKAGTPRAKVYAKLTEKGATKAAAKAGRAPEDDKKVYDVKISDKDFFKGPKNAPITIVEYSDFQCPFCSRVNPTLKQIQDTYKDKVKIVFKHNPLSFHKDAPLASEAALAAGAQGKFWEMHDLLFKNNKALKRPDLDKYAQELGLNMAQFKSDLDSNKFKSQVDADIASARALGATGTPSFFINGRKLRGAQPFPSFKRVIDEELKKKGK